MLPDAAAESAAAQTPPVRPRDWRQKSRGQSLVEFALLTPLLVLFLALAADFGRAFTAYITIGSAAREGAAYGAISTTNSKDTAGMIAAAKADAGTIWGTNPTVTIVHSGNDATKDTWGYAYVEVQVNYTFSPIIKIPPIPNSVAMNRKVRMRVVN
jgi:Flp pilus assembly protein TadG